MLLPRFDGSVSSQVILASRSHLEVTLLLVDVTLLRGGVLGGGSATVFIRADVLARVP